MNKEAVIVISIAVVLLGFSFISNTTEILGFLEEPIIGDGLGTHCDNEQDCVEYCMNNFGKCSHYCDANPQNELCDVIIGGRG